MMAIRLFARTFVNWKEDTVIEALNSIENFKKEKIDEKVQDFKQQINVTKRKIKPVNVEVSYYDWDSIKQMVEHYGNKKVQKIY